MKIGLNKREHCTVTMNGEGFGTHAVIIKNITGKELTIKEFSKPKKQIRLKEVKKTTLTCACCFFVRRSKKGCFDMQIKNSDTTYGDNCIAKLIYYKEII